MNDVRKTCITGELPPPVGTSEQETFSQKCFCVDKTLMIKDIVDGVTTIALFTRPRRFVRSTRRTAPPRFVPKASPKS